ncbi:MAG: hypothetical protein PHQ15_01765 [Methanosarcina sp.]|jgi:hypothetical protein|nr:hypothetical protein [Methanosarcina sp.]NLN43267.1 DUF2892 domain-containing protein [Methanosarcina sp.]
MINNYSELIRGDRVRANTPPEINQAIDTEIAATVRFYAGKTDYEITKRIKELDLEWDIERYLEANAAIFTFIGAALGLKKNQNWFVLPLIVSIFLLQHAVQGWCPPLSIFRRLGIRTMREIEVEKYAMKALRGDFDEISTQYSDINRAKEVISESRSI